MVSFTKTLLGVSLIFCVLGVLGGVLGGLTKPHFYAGEGGGGGSAPAAAAPAQKVSGAKALKEAAIAQIDAKIKENEELIKQGSKVSSRQGKIERLKLAKEEINKARSLKDILNKWGWAKLALSSEQIDKANEAGREATGKGIDEWAAELEKRLKDPANKGKPPKDIEQALAEEIKAAAEKIAEEKRLREEQRRRAQEGMGGPPKSPAGDFRDLERVGP